MRRNEIFDFNAWCVNRNVNHENHEERIVCDDDNDDDDAATTTTTTIPIHSCIIS